MADYYNPNDKVVNSGDIVYANDINRINTAVDSAFALVTADLAVLQVGNEEVGAKNWATAEQGDRPDALLNLYSSKAYAEEAKDWANSGGEVSEATTGLPLAGSASAKTRATEAAGYASTASLHKDTALTHANTASGYATAASNSATTASGHAITASGHATIATTKAQLAADYANKAEDSQVETGTYSAYHWAQKAQDFASFGSAVAAINSLTPAADKVPYYTGASSAALADFTSYGRTLVGLADAAAVKTSLSLNNVPNIDSRNASNINSGALGDSYVSATIARVASPTFTGIPQSVTPSADDNTKKIATTEYVVGQAGTASPANVAGSAVVGTSLKYARQDHVHTFGSNAVATAAIQDSAVTAVKLGDGAVTPKKFNLSADSVGGTANAITAVFTPAVTSLFNGLQCTVRASAVNTSTTPTFTPNSGVVSSKTIVKGANVALVNGDISASGHRLDLQYDSTLDKWVLKNPATGDAAASGVQKFTSSGTFNVPSGVTTIYVSACAGGGGGGGTADTGASSWAAGGGGGGAGQFTIKSSYTVTSGGTVSITINSGGTGGAKGATGTAGGSVVIGSLVTLTGGSGGTASTAVSSGVSYSGVGGAGYGPGGYPQPLASLASNGGALSGIGASGPYGSGGTPVRSSGSTAVAGNAAIGYGAGGGGCGGQYDPAGGTGNTGGAGAPGLVIIEW